MQLLSTIVDLFLHLDEHLTNVVSAYGGWTYALLFIIIFLETGFVVTPVLPGDSLLFAAGALAAISNSALNIVLVFGLLFVAAVLGDTVNYGIGHRVGPLAFDGKIPLLNQKHLQKTQEFYERHGGKTIVLARFIPIVRTFAPFVAGVGIMEYRRFIAFNVVGAFLWTSLFTFAGYFFGHIPIVEKNFELVLVAIVLLSVAPMVVEYVRNRFMRPHGEPA
ncbi:MAG: DedA family protein [Caldilineaceae bacterium]|nr:DedA family protein [Caldilineaceae bacterium]MCB0139292.1 DedA family protein [Caldilineaceae bacterium]